MSSQCPLRLLLEEKYAALVDCADDGTNVADTSMRPPDNFESEWRKSGDNEDTTH